MRGIPLAHPDAVGLVGFELLLLLLLLSCNNRTAPHGRLLQRLFKELFYRKGFQYDNMFDWTVLNLQNERCRTGGSGASGADPRPVSAPRSVTQSLSLVYSEVVKPTGSSPAL